MNLTSLELYTTETLNCGTADLTMLDNIYSVLAEDAQERKEIFEEFPNPSLNTLLFETYITITYAVQEKVNELIKKEKINPEYKNKLTKKAKELTEETPYANCLDTYFQNDLDQTVDFDKNVTENAKELINYWKNNDEEEALQYWHSLEDVPINKNEEIETDWHIFEQGTHREEIWHWFEEEFGVSVKKDLMNK